MGNKANIDDSAPLYIVFAGVNGAGKTTLFHSDLWHCSSARKTMPRVNPDEILRQNGGNWQDKSDQKQAGKLALARIEDLFAKRKTFNQETTLTGHLALQNIKRAHALGYRIFLYYVGVDNTQTALERIDQRVLLGGHSINKEVVERRFASSLQNFSLALDFCEEAIAFDNTREFMQLAAWRHNALAWWGNPRVYGSWLCEAIQSNNWRS